MSVFFKAPQTFSVGNTSSVASLCSSWILQGSSTIQFFWLAEPKLNVCPHFPCFCLPEKSCSTETKYSILFPALLVWKLPWLVWTQVEQTQYFNILMFLCSDWIGYNLIEVHKTGMFGQSQSQQYRKWELRSTFFKCHLCPAHGYSAAGRGKWSLCVLLEKCINNDSTTTRSLCLTECSTLLVLALKHDVFVCHCIWTWWT